MMYGFIPAAEWMVEYQSADGHTYYISDISDDLSYIMWTQKTKSAKRFLTEADCNKLIDQMQRIRNDKRQLRASHV